MAEEDAIQRVLRDNASHAAEALSAADEAVREAALATARALVALDERKDAAQRVLEWRAAHHERLEVKAGE